MTALPSWLKLDWLKELVTSPRVLSVVFVIGAMLLFLPGRFLGYFGLTAIRDDYRKWVGLATVVSFALLLTHIGSFLWSKRQRNRKSARQESQRLQSLETLTGGERLILQHCVATGEQTVFLSLGDPFANSLCHKGLLVIGSSGHSWSYPFMIPNDIWSFLQDVRAQILPNEQPGLETLKRNWEMYNDTPVFKRQDLFR